MNNIAMSKRFTTSNNTLLLLENIHYATVANRTVQDDCFTGGYTECRIDDD